MAEFEELTLEVNLVDNATAQLDVLKKGFAELGVGTQNLENLRRHTAELEKSMKELVEVIGKGPDALIKFATGFGAVGVAIGGAVMSVEKLTRSLTEMAKESVDLGVLAHRIGMDPAETRAMTEALERQNISRAQAQQGLEKFAATMNDVQRGGAGVRGTLQRLGFEGVTRSMEGLFEQIRKLPDLASQWDAVREYARVQGEAEARRSGGAAGVYERQILEIIGSPLMQQATNSMRAAVAEVDEIRRRNEARAIAAGQQQLDLVGKIHSKWSEIARFMGTDIMAGPLGKGLKWIDEKLEGWLNLIKQERAKPSRLERPEEREVPWPQQLDWLFGTGHPKAGFNERFGNWPQTAAPQQQQQPGATAPQRLMGGEGREGVRGFTGPYAPMTPESWKNAADWAEQLHGDYSTNIERRDLMEEENTKTRELINQLKRTNALLSGEEKPSGAALGLLSTQAGGLKPGLGAGGGAAGAPPMGALPGMPGYGGDGRGGDGRPPGAPGAPPPSGTSGTPGVTYPALGTPQLPRVSYAGVAGAPGTPSGPAPGQPPAPVQPLPREGLPGGPSGRALTPAERAAGGAAPPGKDGTPGAAGTPPQTYGDSTAKQAVAQEVANEMRKQGFNENAIAGMLANIKEESAFNPALRHADQPRFSGEAHYAHGLFQEGGAEWNTWAADMRRRGLDPMQAWKDPKEAASFVARRLKGELGDKQYAQLYRDIQNAKSPQEAAKLFASRYLKPAAPYLRSRLAGFERAPPPGVEAYTGRGTPTEGAVPTPPAAAGPTSLPQPGAAGAAGGVIDYSKMSGKRSNEGGMESYIEYAALKSGLNVQVAHGLEAGHKRHRPGSPSYDLDLLDPQTGRRLSANNPGDRERIAKFIEEAAASGATGIGAGYVYMGGHRFHIGGGTPAVWGDGLVRAGAPGWVIAAYERGRAREITAQQRTAELQQMRNAQRVQVAGPVPTPGPPQPPITTPIVTTSPAGTRTETATGTTWTSAQIAESEQDRANRRNLAISHMSGWKGTPSEINQERDDRRNLAISHMSGWKGTPSEISEEEDNRRNAAISHMTGWKGTPSEMAAERDNKRNLGISHMTGWKGTTSEIEKTQDDTRNRAISHMTGWKGTPSEVEEEKDNRRNFALSHMSEWQRGGAFGARPRRERGIVRTPAEEPPRQVDRGVIDAIAGARMRHRSIGTAKIDVNVKGEGQKSVTQTGPFRAVRMSRDTGMTKSNSGPPASSGATGESHDPSLDS